VDACLPCRMPKALVAVTAALLIPSLSAPPAVAAQGRGGHRLCVSHRGACYRSLQSAIDAAQDGDAVVVRPGTYAGGILIDKNLHLIGAGSGRTTIRGGGPVIRIGRFEATTRLRVSISGVTIRGGISRSDVSSQLFGKPGVAAFGGGIAVTPTKGGDAGADLVVRDSVITRNRATPYASVPSGIPCGSEDCPFAWARGGGIDTTGRLVLVRSVVSHNVVGGGTSSDADGAGVSVWHGGSLTMLHSRVSGNLAFPSRANGRYAEGGGLFADEDTTIGIRSSRLDHNSARLVSDRPYEVPGADPIDMSANGGAVHSGGGAHVTVARTQITDNLVSVDDVHGRPYAYDSGVQTYLNTLVMSDSTIARNHLYARTGSSEGSGPSGSSLDFYGGSRITRSRIVGNTVLVVSPHGTATAEGGAYVGQTDRAAVVRRTVIQGNTARAISGTGAANVLGGGLLVEGPVVLTRSRISRNHGSVRGRTGVAHGGGIWVGHLFSDGGSPTHLWLLRSHVTGNRLTSTGGATRAGGGVYSDGYPVSLTRSVIAHNAPSPQCVGCSDSTSRRSPASRLAGKRSH
jgi:hypothetical protein